MKTEELGLAVPWKTGGTRISKGKRKDMPIRGQDEHKYTGMSSTNHMCRKVRRNNVRKVN